MKIRTFIVFALFYVCSTTNVSAAVITGINESTEELVSDGIEVDETGMGWSRANFEFGYLYNGEYSNPSDGFFRTETQFANVVDSSVWFQHYDTYNGFSSNLEIKDATQYTYSSQNIMFAVTGSDWYRGIILAKQGDNYLAIDPLEIYINDLGLYTLKYQYWYGTHGETDLSSVSAPEPSILLLFVIGLMVLVRRQVKISKII